MGSYAVPRSEPRYACDENVHFLITRNTDGKVSIIKSGGRIVERSQRGLRVSCGSDIMTGDTVLVNISGDAAPASLYNPYRIVWHRTFSEVSTFGCRLNPANNPLSLMPVDDPHAPLRPEGSAKTIQSMKHDVFDHLSSISMAFDFLRLEHAFSNRESEYLVFAEKAIEKARESLESFVAFVTDWKGQ